MPPVYSLFCQWAGLAWERKKAQLRISAKLHTCQQHHSNNFPLHTPYQNHCSPCSLLKGAESFFEQYLQQSKGVGHSVHQCYCRCNDHNEEKATLIHSFHLPPSVSLSSCLKHHGPLSFHLFTMVVWYIHIPIHYRYQLHAKDG